MGMTEQTSDSSWKKSILIFILSLLVAGLGATCLKFYSELRRLKASPIFRYEWDDADECFHEIRKTSELIERIDCDVEADGVYEKGIVYDVQGRKSMEVRDENQNGVIELYREFDVTGRLMLEYHDPDEDGRTEFQIMYYQDGSKIKYLDRNKNGVYEIRELYAKDGRLIRRERDQGIRGYKKF